MTQIHVWLNEVVTNAIGDFIVSLGTSSPTDGCECVYVTLAPWFKLVFHMFA